MTTPRTRAIVSFAAALTVTLGLGACARGPARAGLDRPARAADRPLAIRFDNEGREHVHVYLVGEEREWLLGRVEPGARATLRVPNASLAGNPSFVRLAVLTGDRVTLQAARAARVTLTIAQPRAPPAASRDRR